MTETLENATTSSILVRFLRCHMCTDTLEDPISLPCNHSFCQNCITPYWNQQPEERDCAVCKVRLSKDTPGINLPLKALADDLAGREQFNDGKGAKEVLCRKHRKTPTWFCMDEGIAVCEECGPLRHAGHKRVRVAEAVENVREKLQSSLTRMERQLDECIYADEIYKDMVKHMAGQKELAERKIREDFEQLHQFLKEEEEARLAALREEEEQKKILIDRELNIIQGQIWSLENSIRQVEEDLKQDNFSFLKDLKGTTTRARCILQDPQILAGGLLDLASHLGNLKYKVCLKMQDQIQYTPVILDPNTAAGWLMLSDDLTSMTYKAPKQDLPNNPERFMEYAIVLGAEGFTSGTHRWEVDVGRRNKWVMGVARESVGRKEGCYLKPEYGLWSLWKQGDEYHATGKTIALQGSPQRIIVELDLEDGHVHFYDSSDMSLIFRYRKKFEEKMFPYFNTQVDTSEMPIRICPSKRWPGRNYSA